MHGPIRGVERIHGGRQLQWLRRQLQGLEEWVGTDVELVKFLSRTQQSLELPGQPSEAIVGQIELDKIGQTGNGRRDTCELVVTEAENSQVVERPQRDGELAQRVVGKVYLNMAVDGSEIIIMRGAGRVRVRV